jgi:predicted RNA methylase
MSVQDKNCQIPTPTIYVEQMLDYIGYEKNLMGHKVLENSCGEGNILIQIVKRYIADAKKNGYTRSQIVTGLEKDIVAYEIDSEKIKICRKRLDSLAAEENLSSVEWNIINKDFLKSREEKVHFIIGNPPYITYHNLTETERNFLQNNFSVCKKGRFDYCYAFIEASIRALADDGKMIYLIPFSIFRNKFAADLRCLLRNHITKIVDYRNVQVFEGITCSTAMIVCQKLVIEKKVIYEDVSAKQTIILTHSDLSAEGDKWIFCHNKKGNRRFGDYFQIHNSVATLCNKAFIIEVESTSEPYYLCDGNMIEKDVTLQAVSTKSQRSKLKHQKEVRIIFPYKREDGKIVHYVESEFKKKYPKAWEYLHKYNKELGKRKADERAKWFEYGRSQALTEIWDEKLVIPMVITKSTKSYLAEKDAVPYAGYFITVKGKSKLTLKDAQKTLESETFYQYVKDVGTPTTISSYRVSVHDIIEYRF